MKTIVEMQPINRELNIYLAEDDEADCLLFKEAIDELPVKVKLTIVRDGQQLVELLTQEVNTLPDVLFLDLNMPRKNGFAALGQIKRNEKLLNLPVIVLSTANDETKVKMVFKDAAHYYIRKPAKFIELKEVLYKAIKLIAEGNLDLPKQENFLITVEAKSKFNESNPS